MRSALPANHAHANAEPCESLSAIVLIPILEPRLLPPLLSTNDILRNEDDSIRQESERHRVIMWDAH